MGATMVAGAAFGAETGFLVGALAALISNFFFSQGPWTPWQMMAYGVGGLLAGLVFRGRPGWCRPVPLAFFGFASVLLVVGPLLDASTLFTTASVLTWPYVLAVFAAGLPANATLAVATGVTLLLVGEAASGQAREAAGEVRVAGVGATTPFCTKTTLCWQKVTVVNDVRI